MFLKKFKCFSNYCLHPDHKEEASECEGKGLVVLLSKTKTQQELGESQKQTVPPKPSFWCVVFPHTSPKKNLEGCCYIEKMIPTGFERFFSILVAKIIFFHTCWRGLLKITDIKSTLKQISPTLCFLKESLVAETSQYPVVPTSTLWL